MSTLKRMVEICLKAHAGQTRWDGTPYYYHLEAVRQSIEEQYGESPRQIVAVGHDLVEDHPDKWSFEALLAEGFDVDVIDALRLLTRDETKPYLEYIRNILECKLYSKSAHNYARSVKLADLKHNISCFKPEQRRGSMYDKYLLAQYILMNHKPLSF